MPPRRKSTTAPGARRERPARRREEGFCHPPRPLHLEIIEGRAAPAPPARRSGGRLGRTTRPRSSSPLGLSPAPRSALRPGCARTWRCVLAAGSRRPAAPPPAVHGRPSSRGPVARPASPHRRAPRTALALPAQCRGAVGGVGGSASPSLAPGPRHPRSRDRGRARVSRRCWPGSRPARLAPPVAAPHTARRAHHAPSARPARRPHPQRARDAALQALRRRAETETARKLSCAPTRPQTPPRAAGETPPRPPVITVRSRVRASPPAEPNPHPRAPHRCTPLKHDIGRARPPQAGNPARPRRPCAGTTGFRTLQCHPPRHHARKRDEVLLTVLACIR